MKIKWRKHEMILATAVIILIHLRYLLAVYQTNLLQNTLLPDVIMGLLIYFSYLLINLYTIPRLLFPKKIESATFKISTSFSKLSLTGFSKKILRHYVWLITQIVVMIFMLGYAFYRFAYFAQQWQFDYPVSSIFFDSNNFKSKLNLGYCLAAAAFAVIVYSIYIFLRELIISKLTIAKQKEYKTALCNHITLFITCVTITFLSLNFFILFEEQKQILTDLFLFCCAVFAMFFSNVYWLFPVKESSNFFSIKIISRLLFTSFLYSIPLVFCNSLLVNIFPFNKPIFFIEERVAYPFLLTWSILLFIVTPLTWLYFRTNKNKILLLRVVEKQLVKSKADLQFLRSQINPHFLFNVLNTLYGTALQESADRTAEGIQKLGDMMRFMLHENNLDLIDMNREIKYLRNYIALQKLRTQSSPDILIEDNINEQNCNHKIAPMLLIPLVENAFKYGISLKEKSWIKINLSCTPKDIIFEIHNSVHTKTENDPEKERSGIGFKNVMERLKLIYGSRFKISVNDDGKEFFVKLAIEP